MRSFALLLVMLTVRLSLDTTTTSAATPTPTVNPTPTANLSVTPSFSPSGLIAAGEGHTCALVGGSVRCWGNDYYGELGDGRVTLDPQAAPVTVAALGRRTENSTQPESAIGPSSSC
jgi:hypothetical protein